jgi:PAS domain S-box-containing protein
MKKTYKKGEEKLTSEGTELRQPVAELEAPVTDHIQTEQLPGKTEDDKLAILNSISELVIYQDMENRILWTNKASAESVGSTPAQLVGRHCYEIWSQRNQPCAGCPVAKTRQTGKSQKGEITTSDGRTWSIRSYPILDEYDRVTGILELALNLTERKQAEEALRQSEQRYRNLYELAPQAVVTVDKKGVITSCNAATISYTGYSEDEIVGKHFTKLPFHHLSDIPKYIKIFNSLIRGKLPEPFEINYTTKDGTSRWVQAHVGFLGESGSEDGFQVAFEEITKLKQAEQALRKSEEKIRKMFESVTDGISVVDLNSVITEVNQRTLEMHGLGSKDELVGKNAFELVAPQDRKKIAVNMGQAIKEGTISGIEYTLLKADGSEFPAELSTSALKDASGKVIGHITISRDITEHKRAENKLQTILRTALDGFWLTDLEGEILEVNDSYCKMLGYTREELLGKYAWDIEAVDSPEEIAQRIKRVIEQGYDRFETRHKRKDGQIIDVGVSSNYLDVGQGQLSVFSRDITERKRAEQALQAEKNKLQSLIDAMEDDLCIQDKHRNIIYQNKPSKRNFGDHLGDKCYRAFEGNDKVCPDCPVEKAFKDGKSHTSERKTVTLSGEVIYLENTANPVRNASGEIVACFEVGRNITERKQAEEALQAEKNKLQSLIDAIEYALTIQDKEYNIIYQNEPSIISSGGSRIGEKCYRVYEGRDKVCDGCPVEKAFKDGKSHTTERQRLLPSCDISFWENTANPIIDASGKIISCLEVGRDITERKKAEEALKESEEFNSSLLANSPNPMLVINQDTSVRYANPALNKLTGFSRQEVIGRKAPYPWWTEETLKKTAKDLDQAMLQGARRLEELFQKKNGERFWVEITSTPITRNGKFKYYLANWVDITERKKAAEREKEMQRELLLSSRLASIGELAAGVAHQINNPLTGVLGFSQRLLKKSTDQETKQYLNRINTEAERAAKVVQNLLTFARRRQPQKQYSDINEILESALELRAYELKTSNIEVVTDLDPKLPKIMLDFYQIQEVFLNIILNAEQALTEAHSGGKLTIMTVERRGYVRTTFTDDGPGIPAENLDNIFDPFFTTKGEKVGTGLGLSVCHGIITEHGGKIYAKSKPGKGTTFFVELPLTRD